MKAVLYLDGVAQAMSNFAARCGYCRSNFPELPASGRNGKPVEPRVVGRGVPAFRGGAVL